MKLAILIALIVVGIGTGACKDEQHIEATIEARVEATVEARDYDFKEKERLARCEAITHLLQAGAGSLSDETFTMILKEVIDNGCFVD